MSQASKSATEGFYGQLLLCRAGLPSSPQHTWSVRWASLMIVLIPALAAALLSSQDVDTLALRGESTPFLAFFTKWLVTIYLWLPLLIPTWFALLYRPFPRHPVVYSACQLASGPLLVYLHVALSYAILSRLAHTGPFALRHPWQYYRVSRFATELIFYYALVLCLHAIGWYRNSQSEKLKRLRLENELLVSQLQMLGIQLQPHFLFNTLNSISSLMRKDIDAADDLLVEVAAFLRQTLSVSGRSMISLDEELRLARRYCDLQNQRCMHTALLQIEAPSQTLDAQVPPMILQPILENAFMHSRTDALQIEVWTSREADMVHLRIENNGAQLTRTSFENDNRIGLQNVRERLRCLYGSRSSVALSNRTTDGVRVDIKLPFISLIEPARHD